MAEDHLRDLLSFNNLDQNLEESPVEEEEKEAAYFVIRVCDCEKRCTTHSLLRSSLASSPLSSAPKGSIHI